jgi:hypothetical protein
VDALNFGQVMALQRAFLYGRFKCSGAVPKVSVAEYLTDGYALVIGKASTKRFCLGCFKNFFKNKGFRVTENENYLTINSP